MTKSEKIIDIRLFWEIPVAFLSFIFFKTVRLLLRSLANINASINKKTVFRWLVYSDELLRKPLILPSILVTGPRWNPHTIAAGLGPFEVKESLALEVKSCVASAESWSIGIYTFPEAKAIQHIASHHLNLEEEWTQLKLQGKYTLGLRYYHWSEHIDLPAIKIDKNNVTTTQSVNIYDVNNYLVNLTKRDNIFYRCLNYYIFTLLICQKWLPQEWVRKEYLPVGDTNNEFFYGVVYKNYFLCVEIKPVLLNNYDIYLTIYNRSSLPVIWCQIQEEKYTIPVVEQDGFYLVRVRAKLDLVSDNFQSDWMSIKLLPAVKG